MLEAFRWSTPALLNRWAAKLLKVGREMFRDNAIITPGHEFWNRFLWSGPKIKVSAKSGPRHQKGWEALVYAFFTRKMSVNQLNIGGVYRCHASINLFWLRKIGNCFVRYKTIPTLRCKVRRGCPDESPMFWSPT